MRRNAEVFQRLGEWCDKMSDLKNGITGNGRGKGRKGKVRYLCSTESGKKIESNVISCVSQPAWRAWRAAKMRF